MADIVEKDFLRGRSKIVRAGCRRDFRVKMWGTSSPVHQPADDLGTAIEGTRISGRRSVFLQQENWRPVLWHFFNNIGTNRR
jgi:hypothetical protein